MWQHHIPQNIFFRKLYLIIIKTWPCWQQDSLILTGPGSYPQVYHWTPCPPVLICKDGSNSKQRRGRIISNFISYLYKPSDNIAMFSLLFHPSKKGLSFPFSLGKKIIYLETQMKGALTDLFSKLTGHPCSHRQNRNRMMNTFIIVNIAP